MIVSPKTFQTSPCPVVRKIDFDIDSPVSKSNAAKFYSQTIMLGHSRPKDGVAFARFCLAYVPAMTNVGPSTSYMIANSEFLRSVTSMQPG